MLKRVIPYAHELLANTVAKGDTVIDGTCGNGNDTLFLSKLVGESGEVLAFDVQEQAITKTTELLQNNKVTNVDVILDDHQFVEKYIPENLKQNVGGAIFNLGYLPGSDKTIITKPKSTINAVDSILSFLKPGCLIVLVVYHGHSGGEIERDALLKHLSSYDQKNFSVLQYGFINQKNNPPFVLAIEKK